MGAAQHSLGNGLIAPLRHPATGVIAATDMQAEGDTTMAVSA
jgi:hypothetical protein